MSKQRKAGCKEVVPVLKELFESGSSFRGQEEIREELKEKGIEASQITISRALQELGIKRNDVGEWSVETNEDKLQQLRDVFQYAGSTSRFPRMYSDVDFIILRTMPGYNNLIAEKIADTFPNEVLCTMCPDNKNIIVYYRLRKKKTVHTTDDSNNEIENSNVVYKKSRMRQELVKICKSMRQNNKDEKEDEEQ